MSDFNPYTFAGIDPPKKGVKDDDWDPYAFAGVDKPGTTSAPYKDPGKRSPHGGPADVPPPDLSPPANEPGPVRDQGLDHWGLADTIMLNMFAGNDRKKVAEFLQDRSKVMSAQKDATEHDIRSTPEERKAIEQARATHKFEDNAVKSLGAAAGGVVAGEAAAAALPAAFARTAPIATAAISGGTGTATQQALLDANNPDVKLRQMPGRAAEAFGVGAAAGGALKAGEQALAPVASKIVDKLRPQIQEVPPGPVDPYALRNQPISEMPTPAAKPVSNTAAAIAGTAGFAAAGPKGAATMALAVKAAPYVRARATMALAEFAEKVAKGTAGKEAMEIAMGAGVPEDILEGIRATRQSPAKGAEK